MSASYEGLLFQCSGAVNGMEVAIVLHVTKDCLVSFYEQILTSEQFISIVQFS